MSAEADQLDREAEQLRRDADRLERSARSVENAGVHLLDAASALHRRVRDAVGVRWSGPQANRFAAHNEARLGRFGRNSDTFRSVANNMRGAADNARRLASQKQQRAAQLREEERRRAAAAAAAAAARKR